MSYNYKLTDVTIEQLRPKAFQVSRDGRYVWFPRSQVTIDGEEWEGAQVNLVVPGWMVDDKDVDSWVDEAASMRLYE